MEHMKIIQDTLRELGIGKNTSHKNGLSLSYSWHWKTKTGYSV